MAAPAPVDPPAANAFDKEGGVLLFCGATDFDGVGRTKTVATPNLSTPSRFSTLENERFIAISTGPCAVHFAAVTVDGRVLTWGRNETGQLGLGHYDTTFAPTEVKGELEGKKAIAAACGKNHTIVLTADGECYGFGTNNFGELAIGSVKPTKGKDDRANVFTTPVKCRTAPPKIKKVSCGNDFTLMLTEEGKVYACGKGESGVIGDGSEHSYNSASSSIKMVFEEVATPEYVAALDGIKITNIVTGTNHCIAVSEDGRCFTWGNGGFGRLGHRVQQDEYKPREVLEISAGQKQARFPTYAGSLLAAGTTSSLATTAPSGQLFVWGKLKANGDNQMYPFYFEGLSGWNIKEMVCGATTFFINADGVQINWGHAQYQELALGEGGKKSSANPEKVPIFNDVIVHKLGAGVANSVYIVDSKSDLARFPVYTPPPADPTRANKRKAQDEEKAQKAAKKAATGAVKK